MQTYIVVNIRGPGGGQIWGENKIQAKNIDTFRKRWANVYKDSEPNKLRLRVWNEEQHKMIGDLTIKNGRPIWIKAEDPDNVFSYIDLKTGKLLR